MPGPAVATDPALKPYVDRFNEILARDPYLTLHQTASGFTGPDWRALVADLRRDPRASADLTARAETMLAAALHEEGGEEALAAARAARRRIEQAGLTGTALSASVLTTLAEREADAGLGDEALRDATQALHDTERYFGTQSWPYGRAAMAATSAYYALGRYLDAERSSALEETIADSCLASDNSLRAETAADHGTMYGMIGRTADALGAYERAIAWIIAHHHEESDLYSFVLRNYSFSLRNAGRIHEAEGVMRRAVDLDARLRPNDWGHRADGLGKFANLLAAEGRLREAEALWLEARAALLKSHDLGNPLAGSTELRQAADAAEQRGDLRTALARRRQAIALVASRVQPRHSELARMRLEYARTLLLAGRTHSALTIARPAIAIVRDTMADDDFRRLTAEVSYADIVAASGKPLDGFHLAEPAAIRLEQLLLDSATQRGDLVRYAPILSTSFATVTALALRADKPEAAVHALQLANLSEIVLVNAEVAARAAARSPEASALVAAVDRRAAVRRQLDHERALASGQHDSARVLRLDAAIRESDAAIVSDTKRLDSAFPAYAAIRRPRPVALATVQARLATGDMLIAPLSLPARTVTVTITRKALRWATSSVRRDQLIALLQRARGSIDAVRAGAGMFDVTAMRSLTQAILPPPLAKAATNQKSLLFYMSGRLAGLPPALLVTSTTGHDGPAWLIRSHPVATVTRLGADHGDHASVPRSFLGVGAPRLDDKQVGDPLLGTLSLPSLPGAERELRAITGLFPEGDRTLLLGEHATEAELSALPLDRYGLIAFATHGLVADALPGLAEPALVLTPATDARGLQDGLLTASKIAGLHLDADLVILSACDTAGAADAQDTGFNGLASAFVHAGARALLLTAWPVRDDRAAATTSQIVAGMRAGLTPAEAQQRAFLEMKRARTSASNSPADWAAFMTVIP